MRRDWRLLAAVGIAALAALLLLGAWVVLTAAMIGSAMTDQERESVRALLAPRAAPVVLSTFALVGCVVGIAHWAYRRWVAPVARLLEQAQVLASTDVERELTVQAAMGGKTLAEKIKVKAVYGAASWKPGLVCLA